MTAPLFHDSCKEEDPEIPIFYVRYAAANFVFRSSISYIITGNRISSAALRILLIVSTQPSSRRLSTLLINAHSDGSLKLWSNLVPALFQVPHYY